MFKLLFSSIICYVYAMQVNKEEFYVWHNELTYDNIFWEAWCLKSTIVIRLLLQSSEVG